MSDQNGKNNKNDQKDKPEKKDLTAIFDLGFMDHPPTTREEALPQETQLIQATDQTIAHTSEHTFSDPDFLSDFATEPAPTPIELEPIAEPTIPALESIKNYSESTHSLTEDLEIAYPFMFYATGTFTFYEQDKLLRFITENPIGLTAADLDLQIKSGRVFFSRISEYAGIKLIQELRDSALEFKLVPATKDPLDLQEFPNPKHWDLGVPSPSPQQTHRIEVIELKKGSEEEKLYTYLDLIQVSQFLKAEIVELEKSELYQEVIDRMIQSLKARALQRGAQAITQPVIQLQSLRLPSQYQVSISARAFKRV